MQLRTFSEDLNSIIAGTYVDANGNKTFGRAICQSRKYYQTTVGSNQIFLAMFSFLASNKTTERYSNTYNKLKEILNKYGVNGKNFEEHFLQFFPKGNIPEEGSLYKVVANREYSEINNNLKRNAISEQRTMEIEDLILELFNDTSFDIREIFEDVIGSASNTDQMYSEIIVAFKKLRPKERKDAALDEVPELTNLNTWVMENPQKIIDADEKIRKIEMALSGRTIKNALLTGKAGSGKSSYVYELAQRINEGNVPEQFIDKIIYEIDSGKIVAGCRYRGDMEEKITNIITLAKANPNVILFIDEIHNFLDLGAYADQTGGAGNLIKPYMTKGEIQIIGCTTAEEYTKHILPDKAFASRFHEIKIEEPNAEATKEILRGILPVETEYFKRNVQDELVDKIIELSGKYSLDQANPRKSISMLELACAYSRVFEEKKKNVDIDDIINSIKLRYNIYISKNKFSDTKEALFKELLGQDKALKQVLRDIQIVEAGITDPDRPAFSMILAGPSGTGKTRTCEILAKNFFGSEDNIIKIRMGEYASEMDVSKLCGSAPGYVGYDDEPALIKGVREKPNSLVLFDEIEKAHPSIQKILLNILDKGEMEDNKGNKISFRNNIIVFTTNLGCTHDSGKATGIGLIKTPAEIGTKSSIMKAIKNYFSPEFLGRLDDIVYYDFLTKDVLTTLVNRYKREYCNRSSIDFIKNLEFTESELKEIFDESNVETQGARGIRKAVQKKIAEKYAASLEEITV